jgi:nucleotide-binding universal stress UspA family protein
MVTRILVPLDGSSLAETALPAAAALARAFHATVALLHIIEPDAPAEIHRDRHLTTPAEAEAYLADIARRIEGRVETHVHALPPTGVAAGIGRHATDEIPSGLIILTSHGNRGMHDVLVGTIPQKVAATSRIPVLLLKPARPPAAFDPRRILVPLDPESRHDAVLAYAQPLAAACGAQLDLLCVIPTRRTDSGAHAAAGALLPLTAAAYLALSEEMARDHLRGHLEALRQAGIVATATISRGDPARVIARTAAQGAPGLILLGTHGRSGLDALWNRSVAAAVARRTRTPLLLVPAT